MAASWEEASSSSSPIPPNWVYDVFLSFRGVDTRKTFTAHLFATLVGHGFQTFRDDKELTRGEYVSDGLLKAIEESRISVIVFSKKYAESRWCLDELVKIMDCRKTLKQIVLPIFYDIDPSDVRGQNRSLQVTFSNHEERFKEDSDGKVQKWREALTDAASLSSWNLQDVAHGDEAKLIEIVVGEVGKIVDPKELNVADHQVGLEAHLQKVNMLLSMESNDVRIVGIWGIGGIGKTTIAKKLYNRIKCEFDGSSFLAAVREEGLTKLQEQLLSDLCGCGTRNIQNVDQGIEVIKQRAFCRKVLLVLDDVDHNLQLKALAICRNSFVSGSRIIITTRDKSLLAYLGVDENAIFAPKELNHDQSLELFSWHAFKKDHPIQDYEQLSKQVVSHARGLPLVLVVWGGCFSFCKSLTEWKSAIAELRKIPCNDIQKKLEISLHSLSPEGKELFLDVACFFVGSNWDFTIKVLEGCKDFSVVNAIRILVDRCLIKSKDYCNQLVMHDMLKDMGRNFVRQESLEEPGRRSRLWHHEDVLEVLRDGTGTDKAKGLLLNVPKPKDVQVSAKILDKMNRLWSHEHVLEVRRDGKGTVAVEGLPNVVQVNAKAFENMNRLWLLHLDYIHLTAGYDHIPRRLLWLSWKGYPLECMSLNVSMEKLIALDLRYSSLKTSLEGNQGSE